MVPVVHHPNYSFPFPDEHRFPMSKFGLLVQQLRSKGLLRAENSFRPGAAVMNGYMRSIVPITWPVSAPIARVIVSGGA